MDRAPGRIGFKMSTQRRASRMLSAIENHRVELRRLTAPLMSIIWLAWAWFSAIATKNCRRGTGELSRRDAGSLKTTAMEATNSLLSDHHNEPLARLNSRSGSAPPGRTGANDPSSLRVIHRLSLRYVPKPLPVRAHLQTTLPIAPAGEIRWAERHDGKRDLYFQHAA